MELELAINGNEVLNYQRDCRDHICSLTYVRQSELAWITEQIVSALSAATSQRGGWAVADTIKPAVARALAQFSLSVEPAKVLRAAELAAKRVPAA